MLLLASIVLISCTSTAEETTEPTTDAVVETVPVEEAEATVVSEPIAQETITEEEPETEIIDSSMEITADDPEIEQKFSYVYGHLLGEGIASQDLPIVASAFILGSDDFYSYNDPLIDEQTINELFGQYQAFLDGTISEAELEATEAGPFGDLTTFYEMFSYGYGYIVQFNIQNQGILVEQESYNNGISDAFAEVPLAYTDEEIDALFMAYQDKLLAEYNAMVAEYAAQNLADAEAFLAENGEKEGIMTTESGLQYEVITEGEGEKPAETDTVKLDYMLTFLDGTTGDSSYSRGEPSEFAMANLIPGFTEGLTLMPEGSHYRFFVHPDIGYGMEGTESIPPNTLLIFDVELHEIVTE